MDSAGLEEQFSNLLREAGVNPSDPPARVKTFRDPLARIHRLANWRSLAFVGSLLAMVLLLGGGRPPLIRRPPLMRR